MNFRRWWRRWFGGSTAAPTGPASPPATLREMEAAAKAFYSRPVQVGAMEWNTLPDAPQWNVVRREPQPADLSPDGLRVAAEKLVALNGKRPEPDHVVHTRHAMIQRNPHEPDPGPCPCVDCQAQRGETIRLPDLRSGQPIGTEGLRVVQADTSDLFGPPPSVDEVNALRRGRHAAATATFEREFAAAVRREAGTGGYARLARLLGVSRATVSKWASGQIQPSAKHLLLFCVEYDYVFGDFTGKDEFE